MLGAKDDEIKPDDKGESGENKEDFTELDKPEEFEDGGSDSGELNENNQHQPEKLPNEPELLEDMNVSETESNSPENENDPGLPNEQMSDEACSENDENAHETGDYEIEEIDEEKDDNMDTKPSNSTLPSDQKQDTETNQEGLANTGGVGDDQNQNNDAEQSNNGESSKAENTTGAGNDRKSTENNSNQKKRKTNQKFQQNAPEINSDVLKKQKLQEKTDDSKNEKEAENFEVDSDGEMLGVDSALDRENAHGDHKIEKEEIEDGDSGDEMDVGEEEDEKSGAKSKDVKEDKNSVTQEKEKEEEDRKEEFELRDSKDYESFFHSGKFEALEEIFTGATEQA